MLWKQDAIEQRSAYPNPLSVAVLINGEMIAEYVLAPDNKALAVKDFL
jgi:hypothetical protein